MPVKNNQRRKSFVSQFEGTVHHSRGVKGVRQLVIRHLLLERNERQMPTLSLLFLFIQFWTPAYDKMQPTFRAALPYSVIPF